LIQFAHQIARSIVYDKLFRSKEPSITDVPEYDQFMSGEVPFGASSEHVEIVRQALIRWMLAVKAQSEAKLFELKTRGCEKDKNPKDFIRKKLGIDSRQYNALNANMKTLCRRFCILGNPIKVLLRSPDIVPEKAYRHVRFAFCRDSELPLIDALELLRPKFEAAGISDPRTAYRDLRSAAKVGDIGLDLRIRYDNRFVFIHEDSVQQLGELLETKKAKKQLRRMKAQLQETTVMDSDQSKVGENGEEIVSKPKRKVTINAPKRTEKGKDPETGLSLGTMKFTAYQSWAAGKDVEGALQAIRDKYGANDAGKPYGNKSTIVSWFRSFDKDPSRFKKRV